MAEISLKEYLGRVENLLKDRASDEAIHHCRHILKFYPKNVAAYRYLGRALMENSRWKDVREIFSRVLSAVPDDATAHLGLSEVYRHANQLDGAIWHLERAFEQDPGNEGIIANLRELYRTHRNADYPRVQLTAGAVARQYARNGLYDQAIDTLHQALAKTPDRADLRLSLARMLWESGYRVDGAETALEVLRTLPDCLDANRILTELWLSEGRPSDAQRYLSRIEALDPYLALELAQGQPPPDEILRLQELDYERAARRELTTSAPDWLGELGQSSDETPASTTETADWLGSFTEPATEEEVPDFQLDDDDIFNTALPDDWLAETTPAADEPPTSSVPPPRTRTGKTGLLSTFELPEPEPAPEEEFPPTDEIAQPVVDQPPSDFPDEEEPAEDMPDLFSDLEVAEPAQAGAPNADDPLAWMHQSGIELVESAEATVEEDPLGADDEFIIQEPDKASPLAWLEGYGDDKLVAEEADGGTVAPDEEADPLAWLHESGMETIDEDAPEPQQIAPAPQAEETAEDEALLDWLADDSLLDEVLHMESLSTTSDDLTEPESPDQFTHSEPSANLEVEMPSDNENEFDWLSESSQDTDSTSGELDREESSSEAAPSSGDAGLEWIAGAQPVTDSPDWLTEMTPDAEQPEAEDAGPEWMSEAQPEAESEPQAADADFEWMGEADAQPVTDSPDWLTEMTPDAEQPEAEDASLEWMSEAQSTDEQPETQPADSSFEWMSEPEETAGAGSEMPDWMSAMAPIDEPEASGTSPEWQSEIAPAEEGEAVESAADAGLDWLSETAPPGEQVDTETAAADSGFEWVSEAEPTADAPDWLSELAPTDEPSQPAESEWMADAEPQLSDEPEQAEPAADTSFEWAGEAEPTADAPDWLSEIAPANEPGQPTESEFEWMADAEPQLSDEPEQAEPAADTSFEWAGEAAATSSDAPDWLSELAPTDEPGQPAESEWMAEAQLSDEPEQAEPATDTSFEWTGEAAATSSDAPDWLSELAPADEPGQPAESEWMAEAQLSDEPEQAEPAADTSFEWAGEAAATSIDAPDWLSELAPADEPEEIEAEAGSPEWLSQLTVGDEPEEAEHVQEHDTNLEWTGDVEASAADTPDWLSELAPTEAQEELEIDGSEQDWQAAQDEPEWLTEIKTQTSEVKAVEPEPAPVSEFGWLNEMNEQESIPENDLEASSFEEEAIAPTPAENAPDWLNAMVPGLDVDYEAPEDAPIEQEYIESPTPRRLEAEASVAAPGSTRDFDWLNQIVAEESLQQGEPVRERRRFIFSRQPAWLRRPTEQEDAPVATQQAVDEDTDWLLDEEPRDDDDFELPPWLQ